MEWSGEMCDTRGPRLSDCESSDLPIYDYGSNFELYLYLFTCTQLPQQDEDTESDEESIMDSIIRKRIRR